MFYILITQQECNTQVLNDIGDANNKSGLFTFWYLTTQFRAREPCHPTARDMLRD